MSVSRSVPGEEAETPAQIPPGGWWQVVRRAMKEASADNVPMLAGGVAYFAFLAVFPALIAAVSIYGLVAEPETVAAQLRDMAAVLPESAQPLIADQLNAVVSTSGGALTIGLIVSVVAALWSASGGTANLIKAVNIAYDEEESRGAIKLRGIALGLTVGAVLFVLLTLGLVALVPFVLDALPLGVVGRVLAQVVRWLLLIAVVVVALAVVYRIAPDRDAPRFRWVSVGAMVAALLWIIGSVGFSLYVNFFGNYNKTYGALGGVVVLMLWLYLTSYIVLLGAEINAESERQTRRDTTRGPAQPMGTRGAEAADTVAGEPRPHHQEQVANASTGYEPDATARLPQRRRRTRRRPGRSSVREHRRAGRAALHAGVPAGQRGVGARPQRAADQGQAAGYRRRPRRRRGRCGHRQPARAAHRGDRRGGPGAAGVGDGVDRGTGAADRGVDAGAAGQEADPAGHATGARAGHPRRAAGRSGRPGGRPHRS